MNRRCIAVCVLAIIVIGGCGGQTAIEPMVSSQQVSQSLNSNELEQLREEIAALRADVQKVSRQVSRLSAGVIQRASDGTQRPAASRQPNLAVYDVNVVDSPALGLADSPVTIVAFMDFECPYCPREYEKIRQIVAESAGKVQFVLKHHPLNFHKQAGLAAAAAELARMDKGPEGFWMMNDMLFANTKRLQVGDLRQYATKLGLNLQQFDDVMADSGKIDALLAADKAEAAKCKITGTPTVLINGLKLQDRTPEGYKKRIDEILSKPATASAEKKAGPS